MSADKLLQSSLLLNLIAPLFAFQTGQHKCEKIFFREKMFDLQPVQRYKLKSSTMEGRKFRKPGWTKQRKVVLSKIHYTSFLLASPQQVRNKLAASRLRGSHGVTYVMDFGLI